MFSAVHCFKKVPFTFDTKFLSIFNFSLTTVKFPDFSGFSRLVERLYYLFI